LLLALGLGGRWPRVLPSYAAWSALAVGIALAVACYTSAYNPVLNCQANLRLAERDPARAVEHLAAAAVADPLAAEPWRQLAAVNFEAWRQQPNERAYRRFEQCCVTALELAPNCAPAWLAAGDWYFRAYSKTDQPDQKIAGDALDKAVDAYRHAARLYPNSAVCHAKLAEAYRAAGDQSAFRQEAEIALRLDDATSHLDKKLPAELRSRLSRGLNHTP
jgi:tetratricopeptide (TPR) repeat protein